ncbi:MAG: hypothetical protein WCD02_10100 [Terriglobales bacterium]
MNEERASLRFAARMMTRIPKGYPLDVEIALSTVRQVELQPNVRFGTEVRFAEHTIGT